MSEVYFALNARTDMVKIGYAKDVRTRMSSIQSSGGMDVKVLLTVPGGRFEERKFHTQFKRLRERGEWFRNEGKLKDFLANRNLLPIISQPGHSITVPSLALLEGNVRGFCVSEKSKSALLEFGLTERHIYQRGRGAEDIGPCVETFRGRPGWIVMPSDLRLIGTNKREISDRCGAFEKSKIRIFDLSNPEDDTYSAQIQRAHVAISSLRFSDPRVARSQGKWGGVGKGKAAAKRRSDRIADDIVDRLCECPKLTWKERAAILGEGFSAASLFRLHKKI